MKLTELLRPAQIRVPLESTDKQGLIEELVELLPVNGDSRGRILDAVMERERVMSTGIGRAVAIPHGKTEAIEGILGAFGRTAAPVPFDAIDGEPVQLCFLIVSEPRTTGPHIRTLAQISRVLNDPVCKEALLRAETIEDVLTVFREDEEREGLD
jgi:mannitol/fructose-specific phosphotransferase system IIA component (Ntr-type)